MHLYLFERKTFVCLLSLSAAKKSLQAHFFHIDYSLARFERILQAHDLSNVVMLDALRSNPIDVRLLRLWRE